MLGAIAGDIIGSVYEQNNIRTKDFPLFSRNSSFTDNTIMTLAIADCIMQRGDFAQYLRAYGRRYPDTEYGSMFKKWLLSDIAPAYGSWGNGAAIRVNPAAYVGRNVKEVRILAGRTAIVSHNHPDSENGAKAVATAIWLANHGTSPQEIRSEICARYHYNLTPSVKTLRSENPFDTACKGTVQISLICALASNTFEDAVRNAVSLGGASDTLACITGSIAEALHGIPRDIAEKTFSYLTSDLSQVALNFKKRYSLPAEGAASRHNVVSL
jgi:ADP-ribosylglycohydrolase